MFLLALAVKDFITSYYTACTYQSRVIFLPQEILTHLSKARLGWVLKFNKHCSTFVLFDKKISILD
jgi:hypothetical protein